MSKSLVCFEIETEHLGALAPIFVYAENLHIEPVKPAIVENSSIKLPPDVMSLSNKTEVKATNDLSPPQLEARRKGRPGQPSERSIFNPDARNYLNSKVQQIVLKTLLAMPNIKVSYSYLGDAMEEQGFKARSLSPALSWLVREKLVERDSDNKLVWLTPLGKEKAETL